MVESAQFEVFLTRLRELEAELGPNKAISLARRVYYGGAHWETATGVPALSRAEIDATGLPRGPLNCESVWADGPMYRGKFRPPDGRLVDIGHVVVGIDYARNPQPAIVFPSRRMPRLPLPNIARLNARTLLGDMFTAMSNAGDHRLSANAKKRLAMAMRLEGDADWRGDLDALILTKLLADGSGRTVSSLLEDYYRGGDSPLSSMRLELFAQTNPRLAREVDGQTRLRLDALAEALLYAAAGAMVHREPRIFGFALRGALPVYGALQRWLRREAASGNRSD